MSNSTEMLDVKPLSAVVRIINAKTLEDEQEHVVDMANPRSRLWLNKLTWWALHNGRVVEMVNVFDDDEYTSGV